MNESTISMVLGVLVILVAGVLVFNYMQGARPEITPAAETEFANSTETSDLPALHTVQEGEDLWRISEQYYNTGLNWSLIAQANEVRDPNQLTVGQELTIPELDTDPTEAIAEATITATLAPIADTSLNEAEVTQAPEPTLTIAASTEADTQLAEAIDAETYTVVRGDTLWDIAVRAYGDGYKWVEIASANNLVNPDLIHAGNNFVIPR
jgi:nucleoid-associated protein YgaU